MTDLPGRWAAVTPPARTTEGETSMGFVAGLLVGGAFGIAGTIVAFGLAALWMRRAEARELDEVLDVGGFDCEGTGR